MTLNLDVVRLTSDLNDRFPRAVSALAFVAAGLCWGASLAFLGMSLDSIIWFIVAIFAFVTAVCVAFYGTGERRRYQKYIPALLATWLISVGVIVGNWIAGLAIPPL